VLHWTALALVNYTISYWIKATLL